MNSALVSLRSETHAAHQGLEDRLALTSEPNEETYVAYLTAMFGWLEPMEARLQSVPWPGSIDRGARAIKCAWIIEDLTHFGWTEEAIAKIPRAHSQLSIESQTGLIGVLYVIEGSMLGGQAIRKLVRGKVPEVGTRYISGYGSETGPMWREFTGEANRLLTNETQIREACATATATFKEIADWFESQGALK